MDAHKASLDLVGGLAPVFILTLGLLERLAQLLERAARFRLIIATLQRTAASDRYTILWVALRQAAQGPHGRTQGLLRFHREKK